MHRISSPLGIILILLLFSSFVIGNPAIAQDNGTDTATKVHVVQWGETLSDIAQAYNITTHALINANNLASSVDIVVGQRLIIPTREPLVVASTTILGASDSLDAIAVGQGTEMHLIASLNRIINPLQIFAGQAISVPEASAPRNNEVDVVRVDANNSIWKVALSRNMNVQALMRMNGVEDPLIVAPGTFIAVNATEEAESTLFAPWREISIHPLPVEVGRVGALHVTTAAPGSIQVTFLDQVMPAIPDNGGYLAFLPVYRWTEAGLYPLTIQFTGEDGTTSTYTRLIRVNEGGYAAEIIKLSAEDAEVYADVAAVQGEADYIAGLMAGHSPDRLWQGLFQLPAIGVMSSAYGTARSYDSGATYTAFHGGTDFFNKASTPIYAPADGIVVQTGELEVRGFFTVIDHGWGIYTGYWHQSNILVQPGDQVVTGQQIGAIGSTGLSTAAHLHWELWVNGIQVDPLQWAREEFP